MGSLTDSRTLVTFIFNKERQLEYRVGINSYYALLGNPQFLFRDGSEQVVLPVYFRKDGKECDTLINSFEEIPAIFSVCSPKDQGTLIIDTVPMADMETALRDGNVAEAHRLLCRMDAHYAERESALQAAMSALDRLDRVKQKFQ
jgi:hypothetical protein